MLEVDSFLLWRPFLYLFVPGARARGDEEREDGRKETRDEERSDGLRKKRSRIKGNGLKEKEIAISS